MELSIIQSKIYEIRGYKVMLDFDLAEMYQVETKRLNESVKRNIKRFPSDFMFELTKQEWDNLKSQIATSSWGGTRKLPKAFTEQGVAMLSGLLNSDIAIEVNINIMRAFVAVRNYLIQHAETSREISALWQQIKKLEEQSEENLRAINDLSEENQNAFDDIYIALAELAKKQKAITESKPRKPVGYIKPENDK
ncbi:ORF6N domain-containing protein [Dysgonomonas sp. 521]|uniref:ORF6N domain-containing protein n=1 Tax=Dysgonomonas sp. 521 TaxID=2302932 RepID=UPI0013D66494|nr:ORF6N domain-containing protein [Dysgonomonas sp. 521]NDV96573.1 ORF6N domain-containing protein [Dysgonomonas sp. 521]